MEIISYITILFYAGGSAAYIAYLFFQKGYFQKAGAGFVIAGFVLHSLNILLGFIKSGQIPVHNLNETLLIAGWAVVCVFLWVQYKFHIKILGIYAAPMAALALLGALWFYRTPENIKVISNNFWLWLHIFAVFIGEASFAIACGLGILYLLQEHAIKSKNRRFFYKRLPSLEQLDMAGYTCIMVGFLLLTVGLSTGFVYAKLVWGKLWSWDPKEIWSAVTWLLYAALLHQRLSTGWRGRKAAIMAIVGFVVVLFTFLGVNFLLTGHHREFTGY
jgi:cytochrome c-type biogenesis protein CcsB